MADEEKDQKKDDKSKEKGGKKKNNTPRSSMLPMILIGVGVLVLSAAGGVAGALFIPAGGEQAATAEDDEYSEENSAPLGVTEPDEDMEYYTFDPLTVNLNVPRQDRYVKAAVMLGISKSNKDEAFAKVEKNQIFLKNWLMTYLAGHTLDQVKGRKNMVRIQREICDNFNQKLWPERKPRIDRVLFKEFAVQ